MKQKHPSLVRAALLRLDAETEQRSEFRTALTKEMEMLRAGEKKAVALDAAATVGAFVDRYWSNRESDSQTACLRRLANIAVAQSVSTEDIVFALMSRPLSRRPESEATMICQMETAVSRVVAHRLSPLSGSPLVTAHAILQRDEYLFCYGEGSHGRLLAQLLQPARWADTWTNTFGWAGVDYRRRHHLDLPRGLLRGAAADCARLAAQLLSEDEAEIEPFT